MTREEEVAIIVEAMGTTKNRGGFRYGSRHGRLFVIALAICGLTVSLATRTFRLKVQSGSSVTSNSIEAKRQHLQRDAAEWTPPVMIQSPLSVPVSYSSIELPRLESPLVVPVEESLYNRPPPSC